MMQVAGVALYSKKEKTVLISMSKPFRHGSLFAAIDAANKMFHKGMEYDIDPADIIQGFVTEEGMFLTRAEARSLVIASGQLDEKDVQHKTELFSEDLW